MGKEGGHRGTSAIMSTILNFFQLKFALFCAFKLFDFDLEVKPMLEVLVGKTIEQSLLEVMEEEELANLRASQNAYEELRNVELAEVQRLEEQERRHRQEKVGSSTFLSSPRVAL